MDTNFAITTLESELRVMEREEGASRSFDTAKADAAAVAASQIRQGLAILRAALGGPIWPEPTGNQPKPDYGIGAPPALTLTHEMATGRRRIGLTVRRPITEDTHMAKRTGKFPKEIYVGHEPDGEGGSFLVANETPEGMEVANDERRIAVYQFVRVAKLVNKTEVV